MSFTITLICLSIALLACLFDCFFIVKEQSTAIVERFGKFNKISGAGFQTKAPFIDRVVKVMPLQIQEVHVQVETKTKDNVFVFLDISLQLVVKTVYEAYYKLADPTSQIKSYVFDIVRASVPKLDLTELFEKKDDIANDVKEHLAGTMEQYGWTIVKALVLDINPDKAVKESLNAIMASQNAKVTAMNNAEANKITLVKAAEAEAEAKALQGTGIANERKAIIAGLEESVEKFQDGVKGVDAKDVMALVILTQYFDTLKDIGANNKSSVILTPHSPGGLTDIQTQIMQAFETTKHA